MGFMEAQMTERMDWVEIDGDNGITWIPADETGFSTDECALANESEDYAAFLPYYDGRTIDSVSITTGYGVRSSAPGYMDCTEWTVYTSEEEAYTAYESEREENGEPDSSEDGEPEEWIDLANPPQP